MSVGEWLAPTLAFVGGGAGAWLAFLGTHSATRQAEGAGRREEWGRRFAQALSLLADERPRQRQIGRALLVQLLDSQLATDDDRATADRIIALDAQPTRTQLAAVPSPEELDAARFVRDDGDTGDDEGSSGR